MKTKLFLKITILILLLSFIFKNKTYASPFTDASWNVSTTVG